MPIGTSDGQSFETEAQYQLQKQQPITQKQPEMVVDRDHDVPFMAAALDDGTGFKGIAIDRRIPHYMTLHDGEKNVTIPSHLGVMVHEAMEWWDMEHHGNSYKESHDNMGTPSEKEWVHDLAEQHGMDKDKTWQSYQGHWSSWLDTVQKHEPEKVHPHTYLAPYKESEPGLYEKMVKALEKTREAMDKYSPNWETGLLLSRGLPGKTLPGLRAPKTAAGKLTNSEVLDDLANRIARKADWHKYYGTQEQQDRALSVNPGRSYEPPAETNRGPWAKGDETVEKKL